jgi:hypothetical protein
MNHMKLEKVNFKADKNVLQRSGTFIDQSFGPWDETMDFTSLTALLFFQRLTDSVKGWVTDSAATVATIGTP